MSIKSSSSGKKGAPVQLWHFWLNKEDISRIVDPSTPVKLNMPDFTPISSTQYLVINDF
jgi:hypothetical protein